MAGTYVEELLRHVYSAAGGTDMARSLCGVPRDSVCQAKYDNFRCDFCVLNGVLYVYRCDFDPFLNYNKKESFINFLLVRFSLQ